MRAWAIRTASILATLSAAIAILAVSSPAAAFRTQNYTHVLKVFSLNQIGIARGAVSCPAGKLVIAGGAYWFRPGQPLGQVDAAGGSLMVNTPTASGHGWLAIGGAASGEKLAVSIFCLPQAALGGAYVIRTKLLTPISDPFDAAHYAISSRQLSCPSGQKAVTGGAGWYSTAQQGYVASDAYRSELTSDSPLSAGSWWAAGFQRTTQNPVSNRFAITVLCRPSGFVGPFSITKTDFTITSGNLAYGYKACAGTHQIVASGAYWHDAGQSPQNSRISALQLTALAPTTDKAGMWAAGYNGAGSTEHIIYVVECRPI